MHKAKNRKIQYFLVKGCVGTHYSPAYPNLNTVYRGYKRRNSDTYSLRFYSWYDNSWERTHYDIDKLVPITKEEVIKMYQPLTNWTNLFKHGT